jgi:hypothetical protein
VASASGNNRNCLDVVCNVPVEQDVIPFLDKHVCETESAELPQSPIAPASRFRRIFTTQGDGSRRHPVAGVSLAKQRSSMKPPQPPYKNRILAALPKAEIERLARHLSPVTLPQQKTLLDGKATHGYFLEQGIASVVVTVANGDTVEVGVIGIDGIVGLPILLGTEGSPGRTFIQIEDSGFRIDAGTLRREFERTSELRLTDINGTVLGNWIVLEVQDFDTPDFNFLSKCISEDSLSRMLSMQPGVLGFGLPVDGDVGIGVFPEGEEILIRGTGLIATRGVFGSVEGVSAS